MKKRGQIIFKAGVFDIGTFRMLYLRDKVWRSPAGVYFLGEKGIISGQKKYYFLDKKVSKVWRSRPKKYQKYHFLDPKSIKSITFWRSPVGVYFPGEKWPLFRMHFLIKKVDLLVTKAFKNHIKSYKFIEIHAFLSFWGTIVVHPYLRTGDRRLSPPSPFTKNSGPCSF